MEAAYPGGSHPKIVPQSNPNIGYVWGYPPGMPPMVPQHPSGPEGSYGWPIYVQGGTPSNPKFAYYPVPPGAAPPGTVPPPEAHRHRRRPPRVDDEDDDDDQCTCPECIRAAAGKATSGARAVPVVPPPQPTTFIPTQVFAPPAPHQSTTFIPYVVPNHCYCGEKSASSCASHPCGHKKYSKKDSTGNSSYHYAASCDCPSCKARRMAVEMDRIKEERRREREYQDAKEFMKMKERVDREDREAEIAEEYRAAKKAAVAVEEDARMYRHMMREGEYEWAVPVPMPITAYHPGSATPITLHPVNPGGYQSGWCDHLAEENTKLRYEKDHLKEKCQRERSFRNKDEATRAFFSTRLQDLDQDVQDLKKKVRVSHGRIPSQGSVLEIQIPTNKHHHSQGKKVAVSAPQKNQDKKAKGNSKDADSPRNSSGRVTVKTKTTNSKHKQPHICHDSDCDDYDSCSDCSFECHKKGISREFQTPTRAPAEIMLPLAVRFRSATSTQRRDRPSRAQQAAAADSGAYKPREERSYIEFHPDFDIDAEINAYDSREIDGSPLPIGFPPSTTGKTLNGIQIRVEQVQDGPSTAPTPAPSNNAPCASGYPVDANGTAPSEGSKPSSSKGDDESQASSSREHKELTPNPILNTPTRRSSRQKDNKEREKERSHPTPKPATQRPILPMSNIHHNERLSLPVPSYKSIVPFQLAETYVDRAMAGVGFQETDYWAKPYTMVRNIGIQDNINEGEAKISSVAEDKEESNHATHAIVPGIVEYDMDEQDDKWLTQFNNLRRSQDVPTITREIFEITITKIEREWYALEKMIPKQSVHAAHVKKGNDDDDEDTSEDSRCQICDDGECENSNAIVFCDGCNIAVHQDCYGVPFIPEGQWLCRRCSLLAPRREVNCIFCPNTDGAFKMTDSSLWSHLLCAIWIPEVTISNMVYMEPVEGVDLVPKSRWKLCSNKNCYLAFHVTCARKAKLYLSMRQVPTDSSGVAAIGTERNLIFDGSQLKAFCDKHVPTEWRREYRTDIAIRNVQAYFEDTFYDKEWGDSQMKALAGPSAFGTPMQKLTLTLGGKRKRPSNVRKPKEYVAEICKYWTLKREARRDASLLKRLQISASSNFTSDEVTKKDYSAMYDGEEKLKRRLDFAIKLRHDLERIRLLADDIKKREKEKLRQAECLKEMIDAVYFPVVPILTPILERAQQLDSKDFFKGEFGKIKQKLHDREYTTVSQFSRDILSTLTASVTSRSKFAVTAVAEISDHTDEYTTGVWSSAATPAAVNVPNPLESQLLLTASIPPPAAPKQNKALGDTAGKTAGRILRVIQPMLENAKLQEIAMREDPNERLAGEVDERYQEILLERKKRDEEIQTHPGVGDESDRVDFDIDDAAGDKMDLDDPLVEQEANDRAAEEVLESVTATLSQSHQKDDETDRIVGIPWYTKPFSPMGATLLSEERWMGMDVVRDMSPLSELDEDAIERLQRSESPEDGGSIEGDDGCHFAGTPAASSNESASTKERPVSRTSTNASAWAAGTRVSLRTTKGTKRVSYVDTQYLQPAQPSEPSTAKSNVWPAVREVDLNQVVVIGSTRSQTKQAIHKAQRRGRGYVWVEVDEEDKAEKLINGEAVAAGREEMSATDFDAMDIDSELLPASEVEPAGIGNDTEIANGGGENPESIDSPLTSVPDDPLDPEDHLSLGSSDLKLLDEEKEIGESGPTRGSESITLAGPESTDDNMDTENTDTEFHTPVEIASDERPLEVRSTEAVDGGPADQLSTEESFAVAAITAPQYPMPPIETLERSKSMSPSKRNTRSSPKQKDGTASSQVADVGATDPASPTGEAKDGPLGENDTVETPNATPKKLSPTGKDGLAFSPAPMTTRSRKVLEAETTPTRRGSRMEHQVSSNVDLIVRLVNRDASPAFIKYCVTAWSLQQASPVFSRIISPDPRFKQPSQTQFAGKVCLLVTLEDDNPEALLIVFHLLHLNTKSLPAIKELPWDTLREIAAIWDKYDLSNLIRPPWLKHFENRMMEVGYEDWLFIAKVFKVEERYAELTARLVIEIGETRRSRGTAIDENAAFLRVGTVIKTSSWPSLIKDHIKAERSQLLNRIDNLLANWKRSFRGKRPRAICTCFGNILRFNRHMTLATEIALLLSGPASILNWTHTRTPIRLSDRFPEITGSEDWQWKNSIAELKGQMAKIRDLLQDRDLRMIRTMVENPDIYDLCPLEESALRILLDFNDIIAYIKGVTIDGVRMEFNVDTLLADGKGDPWNRASSQTKWDGLTLFVMRICGISVAVIAAVNLASPYAAVVD
ncbi:Peregrin [Drechslerella dactyloides]|uniref:Peregrin n=1 Tax=Drechslerella dactyloides TaxID=74499 RepID=A0AAD6IUD1_DREDA|nr:Peregrin [Drechslerella dactyloides]